MRSHSRLLRGLFALVLVLGPVAACNDDPGEDQIGDDEIIDEGD